MTFTRTSSTTGQPRVLDTVIWYPVDGKAGGEPKQDAAPAGKGGPFAVVIFSHGFCGEPTQASYLTEHLASWGFVVVAPPRPGNTKQDGDCNDSAAIGETFGNRVPDIMFTLDQILALKDDPSQPLGAILDPERTAITGFSFGAGSAVLTAPENRFDVIVALAPGPGPTSLIETGKALKVPIMVESGGEDISVPADEVQQLYEALPSDIPHYLLFFPKAEHHSMINECETTCELTQERAHELINRYVTAFLETYLVDSDKYLRYLKEGEPPDMELTDATGSP